MYKLTVRAEISGKMDGMGLVRPSMQWLGLPVMAALLALTACGAAAPTDMPAASTITATLSPPSLQNEAAQSQATQGETTQSGTTPQETQRPSPVAATCVSPASLTPASTEGPYFKAGSPERQSLIEDNTPGKHLVLTGYVLTPDCQPMPRALLDFWQADGEGVYDNNGYRLRGHQFTDTNGLYHLETVVPGEYPGRTPHIHVKVQPPNGPVLTSQVYFPGTASNEADSIFSPQLLVNVVQSNGDMEATFDFIVSPE